MINLMVATFNLMIAFSAVESAYEAKFYKQKDWYYLFMILAYLNFWCVFGNIRQAFL